MEDGRPFYPDMKREEPWLLEFDAGGSMRIHNINDRPKEMFQSLDPTYTLPELVVLPGTLRRSARFNGYVPGRYYESD
jgi:hypothetical protein